MNSLRENSPDGDVLRPFFEFVYKFPQVLAKIVRINIRILAQLIYSNKGKIMELVDAIDRQVGEVRTDNIDMSVGEIISLHEAKELIIQPDFQRLFRWSNDQRSRLIESLLIELPIPSIFTIENEKGELELIDGLQRISSTIQFINSVALNLDPLVLSGCDLVKELNSARFSDLPLTLKLRLKRSAVRTIIIKRQSSRFLRYEMFKRLNGGGSKLSDQDVRNVNARMIGAAGADFYSFLVKCSDYVSFKVTIETMPVSAVEARAHEELVLRFFAAKNHREYFKGSISDWLDEYMEGILLGTYQFDMDEEFSEFTQLFDALANNFGAYAFVKYRGKEPMGSVAPAYFEAVTCGLLDVIPRLNSMGQQSAREILARTVESAAFRAVTGPGANSLPKLRDRISIISSAFS